MWMSGACYTASATFPPGYDDRVTHKSLVSWVKQRWFLAMDFDKASWREDAVACRDTCRSLGLPAALERSR
jgi:hypothetical protein